MSKVLAAAMMAAAVMAAGCTRVPNVEGYIADEQLLASVQPGVDNKASVQRTLGRPTLQSRFGPEQWFYVSRQTKQLAFLRPRPSSQNVLIVHFDAKDTVSRVERRGLERVADITPNGDATPTRGRDQSLLDDIFGNIGAVGSLPGGGGDGGGTGRDGPR